MKRWQKIALGLGGLYILFGRRGGGMISRTSAGSINVIPLAQGASPWGQTLVGVTSDSTKTCANVGCVATAMAMAVNALRSRDFTPADLRPGQRAGLTSAAYSGVAMLTSTAASELGLKIVGRLADVKRDAEGLAEMRRAMDHALENNGLAIVRVDYDLSSPETNHSVLVFARDATGYKAADPANGKVITIPSDTLLLPKPSSSRPDRVYAVTGVAPIFRA